MKRAMFNRPHYPSVYTLTGLSTVPYNVGPNHIRLRPETTRYAYSPKLPVKDLFFNGSSRATI